MIKVYKNTKIYILTPFSVTTGGPEALHQLADTINKYAGNAYNIYLDHNYEIKRNGTATRYKKYFVKKAISVKDVAENILIIPEVYTEIISKFSHIQKVVWWLSVDNNKNKFNSFEDDRINHLYQSYYAMDFLQKKGVKNLYPLFDYLNIYRLKFNQSKKKDFICYNPKKGFEVTEQIIKKLEFKYKFIPLINLDLKQLINALEVSKLYIDFGNHPGKDRIPREAALAGNIIITSLNGSANFFLDVPINKEYKFNTDNIDVICKFIEKAMLNYNLMITDFLYYRKTIKLQKIEFESQVKCLFIDTVDISSIIYYYIKNIIQIRFYYSLLLDWIKKHLPIGVKMIIKKFFIKNKY